MLRSKLVDSASKCLILCGLLSNNLLADNTQDPTEICIEAYNQHSQQKHNQHSHTQQSQTQHGLLLANEVCYRQKERTIKNGNDSKNFAITRVLVKINQKLGDHDLISELLKDAKSLATSDLEKHTVLRDHGSYYYHLGLFSQAETHFEQGLVLAKSTAAPKLIAKSLNDLGLINLRKLKYKEALTYFHESLTIKESLNLESQSAVTINNIALVYYRIGENKKALTFYLDALKKYNKVLQDKPNSKSIASRIIHIHTDLSAVYSRLNESKLSRAALDQVLTAIKSFKTPALKISRLIDLAEGLVEGVVESTDLKIAKGLLYEAKALIKNPKSNLSRLFYLLAKVEYETQQFTLASIYVEKAISLAENHNDHIILLNVYQLDSEIKDENGNPKEALISFKQHTQINNDNNEKKFDEQLSQIKSNLETELFQRQLVERDHELLLSTSKNQLLFLILIIALAIIIIISVLFYSRSRLNHEKGKQLSLELKSHLSKLKELEKPLISFKNVFSDIEEKVLVCNDSGYLIYSNISQLSIDEIVHPVNLKDLSKDLSHALDDALNASNSYNGEIEKSQWFGEKCFFKLTPVMNNDYFVFELYLDEKGSLSVQNKINLINRFSQSINSSNRDINDTSELRIIMVEVMELCVKAWIDMNKLNKIEFAEASKIWKINIDEGRLRTRSLDKYLSLKSLPKNPRLNNIIKTCHFMLSYKDLPTSVRETINEYLNRILAFGDS